MISKMPINNRYLVAKYVRDLKRQETRNIGIFLWADGRVVSRFLDNNDARFVADKDNYDRWKSFWTDEISADAIKPLRGPAVPRSQPEFMDALLAKQDGNYRLFDGGRVRDSLSGEELDDAADFLFSELVDTPHAKEDASSHESLKGLADRVMRESALNYKPALTVECPVLGVKQSIVIDYGIGTDDNLHAAFMRVRINAPMNARGAAVAISSLTAKYRSLGRRCCSLVDLSNAPADSGLLEMLRSVGEVADVSQPDMAISGVLRVAEMIA